MTTALQHLRRVAGETADRWFVAPRSAWPLAIARVLLGVAILVWSVSMLFDVTDLLGENAVVAPRFASNLNRYIDLDSAAAGSIALGGLILCSLGIIVGWRPTIWLLVAFVLLVAIQRRNTMILNSGDIILRNLTFLLAFAPTGAAMSVDRVRRHGRGAFFTSAQVAPWGMRLVQFQMMVVYFFAFWSKSGDLWQNGTAVSTALRLTDLQRFGQLELLVDNIWMVALLTWGTLAVEVVLALLLWVKRLRPALIVLGIALHLGIDGLILVGPFGIAMIAGLMTFLDAERIDAAVRRRRSPDSIVGDQPIEASFDSSAATV